MSTSEPESPVSNVPQVLEVHDDMHDVMLHEVPQEDQLTKYVDANSESSTSTTTVLEVQGENDLKLACQDVEKITISINTPETPPQVTEVPVVSEVSVNESSISSRELAEKRLTEIYTTYNPAKLADLGGLLDKYQGHENDLVAAAEEKYCKVSEQKVLFSLSKFRKVHSFLTCSFH